jgi:hypothetical protein
MTEFQAPYAASPYEPVLHRNVGPGPAPIARPVANTARERIYVHEIIDTSIRYRREYLNAFCDMANARVSGGSSRLLGSWASLAHRNSEMIQIWEHDSKDTIAAALPDTWSFLYAEVPHSSWSHWSKKPEVKETQGMDRFMTGADYTPSVAELVATGVTGEVYLHMNFTTRPGGAEDHLARLGRDWLPVARRMGLKFVGAYRTLLVNDDMGLSIWAFPTWADWARYEDQRLTDPDARAWFAQCAADGVVMDGRLLIASACTPMRTGKVL